MSVQPVPRKGERDALVEDNAALVYAVAKRFFGRAGMDNDDIVQAGFMGLLSAAERFDPSRGFRFSTYAVPLIIGEIKTQLRSTGAMHVSRTLRERASDAAAITENLRAELKREPRVEEVAERMGVSAAEAALALSSTQAVESLDVPDAPEPAGETFPEDRVALLEVVNTLPARERRVILLRYFREMPQREVADAMGLSQPQVSRMEKRALDLLRGDLL